MALKSRTSSRPLQVHYRQSRRPAAGSALAIGAAVVALAAAVFAWQSPGLARLVPAVAPTVTVTATDTPNPPAPSEVPDAVQAATPDVDVEEGRDYAFMGKVDGEPISWGCAAPISVATNGEVPAGTQDALHKAVGMLRDASNLPLQVATPDTGADITVYYVAPGATRGHITLEGGGNLGKGGPTSTDGRITSGLVLIRNDVHTTDPTAPDGIAVLMHELAHTLGLSHADQSTGELMTPSHAIGSTPVLGRGDKTALGLVGCP